MVGFCSLAPPSMVLHELVPSLVVTRFHINCRLALLDGGLELGLGLAAGLPKGHPLLHARPPRLHIDGKQLMCILVATGLGMSSWRAAVAQWGCRQLYAVIAMGWVF